MKLKVKNYVHMYVRKNISFFECAHLICLFFVGLYTKKSYKTGEFYSL